MHTGPFRCRRTGRWEQWISGAHCFEICPIWVFVRRSGMQLFRFRGEIQRRRLSISLVEDVESTARAESEEDNALPHCPTLRPLLLATSLPPTPTPPHCPHCPPRLSLRYRHLRTTARCLISEVSDEEAKQLHRDRTLGLPANSRTSLVVESLAFFVPGFSMRLISSPF